MNKKAMQITKTYFLILNLLTLQTEHFEGINNSYFHIQYSVKLKPHNWSAS